MGQAASELALKAAKAFVKDIEFFRSHGTGDMNKRYADHLSGDGYSWIARPTRYRLTPAEEALGREIARQSVS